MEFHEARHAERQLRWLAAAGEAQLTGGGEAAERLRAIEIELLPAPNIHDTGHPDNVVVEERRRFFNLCAALADQGFGPSPEQLTVFDFQGKVEYLLDKNKAKN